MDAETGGRIGLENLACARMKMRSMRQFFCTKVYRVSFTDAYEPVKRAELVWLCEQMFICRNMEESACNGVGRGV